MQEEKTGIEDVRLRVQRLRREVQVACAELGLAHDALERHMPPRLKTGDVAWAIAQSGAVEERLEEAASELLALQHLLERMVRAGN